jgi:hypothetical protein
MTVSLARSIVVATDVACTNPLLRCARQDRRVTPNVGVSRDAIARATKSVKTTTSAQPTNVVCCQVAIVCLIRFPTTFRAQMVVHAVVASVLVPFRDPFNAALNA